MRAIVRWLHSADTVWKLQHYCGVEKIKTDENENGKKESYKINNIFLYYLFKFGSMLGQEEFYSLLFPFWFWNLDPATGRKLMFIWMVAMYIGQTLKDYLRSPRPNSPPAVQLETIYLSEYGLPSTHAIVGACLPFSVICFEKERCQIPAFYGYSFAFCWTLLVCLSRIYVGMHSIMEVLAGLMISFGVMTAFVPRADFLDAWYMNSWFGPILLTLCCIFFACIYPRVDNKFTPAWADSTAILGSTIGVLVGSWAEYKTGFVDDFVDHECKFLWPQTVYLLSMMIAKTLVGLFVILSIKETTKILYYRFMCYWFGLTEIELRQKYQWYAEMPGKLLSYYVVGFQVFLTPALTKLLNAWIM